MKARNCRPFSVSTPHQLCMRCSGQGFHVSISVSFCMTSVVPYQIKYNSPSTMCVWEDTNKNLVLIWPTQPTDVFTSFLFWVFMFFCPPSRHFSFINQEIYIYFLNRDGLEWKEVCPASPRIPSLQEGHMLNVSLEKLTKLLPRYPTRMPAQKLGPHLSTATGLLRQGTGHTFASQSWPRTTPLL